MQEIRKFPFTADNIGHPAQAIPRPIEEKLAYLEQRWDYYCKQPRFSKENSAQIEARCKKDILEYFKTLSQKKTDVPKASQSNVHTLASFIATPLPNPWANQKSMADEGLQIRGISQEELDHGMVGATITMNANGISVKDKKTGQWRFLCSMTDPNLDQKMAAWENEGVTWDMCGAPDPTRQGMYNGCFTMGASSSFLEGLVKGCRSGLHFKDWPWDCDDLFRCVVFIQCHVKGNEEEREELTNQLAQIRGLSLYWKALLTNWTYLTKEVLYSNRLSIEVISTMLSLIMGYTTGDFGFLTNKTMTAELEGLIRQAQAEIDQVWANYDWTNASGRFRLVAYVARNENGRHEAQVVAGEDPDGFAAQITRRFADILNSSELE